jgi:hypothetical protein
MADPRILSRIIQLGKELGANISNSIGTKSNVNFLGSGPKDGMLFQKDINPESFLAIGTQKVLPDIESSIGYATGNKLNGFQLEQLEKNLLTMKESLNPTNVVEMGGAGIDSLRAKSGMVERQGTEAASDIKSIDDAQAGVNAADAAADTTPLMSKIENRIGGMRGDIENRVGTLLDDVGMTPQAIDASIASDKAGIMASVAKGDLPGKTAAAREFLVNTLKVGDDYPTTKLDDVISAEDFKYIMEGGGGAEGDPLVLVQKYFGPRIAEMIPQGGTTEEIAIFTKKILNNVEDARGLRPNEEGFDTMTAKIVDDLSDGTYSFGYQKGKEFQNNVNSMGKGTLKEIIDSGELVGDDLQAALNALRSRKADGGLAGLETRQGLRIGGKAGKTILSKINDKMIKKAADDIFPTDDYKYDAELVVDALVENNPKLFKNLLADDLDDALRSELYGLAVSETGTRAAMKIKAGKMERPLFDKNGNLNKDAVLADATKFSGLDGRKDAVKRGIVNENIPEFKRQSMKLVDGETSKGEKFKTFETTTAPRMFTLNVEKAVSELNIPREEAIRIASLPSDQQKIALQIYLDKNMAQRTELMNYSPKTFDAAKGGRAGYAKGGLAKILEL